MNKFVMSAAIVTGTLLSIFTAKVASAQSVERHYCTQFGPFFLRFDPDKAAGVFTIKINHDLGSVVGKLNDRLFDGVWHEVDSHGLIRLTFSEEWDKFDATYNLHETPEVWHEGWVGRLAPKGRPTSFQVKDKTFYCD